MFKKMFYIFEIPKWRSIEFNAHIVRPFCFTMTLTKHESEK